MERQLQERLVGAAVLVMVAVILIPELLSGPGHDAARDAPPADDPDNAALRTYTIDLSQPAKPITPADESPAHSAVQLDPPAAASTEPAAGSPPAASAPREPEGETQRAGEAEKETAPAAAAPPSRSSASRTAAANGDWAVQVGSFANRVTAERLARDLDKRGYPSFVMPFRTGGSTLHRVRVGPMARRADADATARKLKAEGTTAAVVSQP